jgi:hypothetical protein
MATALAIMVAATVSTHPGFAQSQSETRQKATRQAQQIEDLKAEVEALQNRILTLESVIGDLKKRMVALERSEDGDVTEPIETVMAPVEPPPPPVAVTAERPKDVFASPATILAGLKWDFRNDLTKDPSFALGVDSNNERARLEANNILNSWLQRMNRIYRKSVTWSVRVLDEGIYDKDSKRFLMQALATDGSPAGDPFSMITTNRIARRIEGWLEQPKLERMLMKGTFEPKLTAINTEASEQEEKSPATSAEEIPISVVEVSPYVAFEYSIRLSTIMPVFGEPEGEANTNGS